MMNLVLKGDIKTEVIKLVQSGDLLLTCHIHEKQLNLTFIIINFYMYKKKATKEETKHAINLNADTYR